MRLHGQRTARRRLGPPRGGLAVLVLLAAIPAPAAAQEPLFIRIRPPSEAGSAQAAREALWARRQAHARAVIESVCTGCLGTWAPPDPLPTPAPAQVTAVAATPAASEGLETDPVSGASGPTSEPPTSERRP